MNSSHVYGYWQICSRFTWEITCDSFGRSSAQDIRSAVDSFDLHYVDGVWLEGADGAHHKVSTKLWVRRRFQGTFQGSLDLVWTGTRDLIPLDHHTFRCYRVHRQDHSCKKVMPTFNYIITSEFLHSVITCYCLTIKKVWDFPPSFTIDHT